MPISQRRVFQSGLILFILFGFAHMGVGAKQSIRLGDAVSSEPRSGGAVCLGFFSGVREAWAEGEDAKETEVKNQEAEAKDAKGESGDYPEEVRDAIERRSARRNELLSWEKKGVIGENMHGHVEIVKRGASKKNNLVALVEQENRDRSAIYAYVAKKDKVSVNETVRFFTRKIQTEAPAKTPIQCFNGEWTVK
ncbi:hypothetical protein BU251_01475 [Candidatus Velamenicoccus archaeovorus]|uniref:DUF1318 domain-containing protein n=1 Tax=Velamenicoccus archaeovorus TaxID=1930593 RepID=A0A410P2Z3_VELA1|nr:hypothetical protein BU251_01475 [Candidatus Velamenicoccus archaeovorus]